MDRELVCNKCGKKFDVWDTQENFTIKSDLGYGTKYDGEKLDIKLCCNCMETLIDECVISPIAENNNT